MQNFPAKQTGVYRLRNGINIDELKFEVQLRLLNLMLPFKVSSDKAKNKVNEKHHSIVKLKFGWQEKVLSPTEVALYRNAKNCRTKIQKKYHKWVQEEDRLQEATDNLWLVPYKEGRRQRSSKRTVQMQKLMAERKPSQIHMISTYIESDKFGTKTAETKADLVSFCKHRFKYDARYDELEPYQLMVVYADLKPTTELVRFLWDPNENQLYVYPDFCQSPQQFYYMEIINSSRHLYAYSFENITSLQRCLTMTNNNLRSRRIPRKFLYNHSSFCKPPRRTRRVTLLLQLNAGENFEYDNIHVRYQIKLPDNTFLEYGSVEATTQSCTGGTHIAHFYYNWEVSVICEELYRPEDLLYIYFEVISIDSWERERDEGYAVYSCQLLDPLHPKSKQPQKLQCVRPVGTRCNALHRYFFGGRQKFDYMTYLTPSTNGHSTNINTRRYNTDVLMKKTGQLTLTISKVNQRYFQTTLERSRRTRPLDMDFEDILRAYHEAQERLEEMIELRKRQEKEGYGKDFKFSFESL